MPRGKADVANTALRIFLQEMGAAYDAKRGLPPYDGRKHFNEVQRFFSQQCCYCGVQLSPGRCVQDHLVPMNKQRLGLHAWGNIVPACQTCNGGKQGGEWHAYLMMVAGHDAAQRYERITRFVKHYEYSPDHGNLRNIAEDLYEEIGAIAMTLINTKIARFGRSL